MSLYQGRQSLPRRFRLVLSSFLQKPSLPFAGVLREEEIQNVFDQEGISFAEGTRHGRERP